MERSVKIITAFEKELINECKKNGIILVKNQTGIYTTSFNFNGEGLIQEIIKTIIIEIYEKHLILQK
jgi:hypothetical protein